MTYDSSFLASKRLDTPIQEYIHISKYSRWIEEENRRETWYETCKRYADFVLARSEKLGSVLTEEEYLGLLSAILNCESMPSMRALMTAGPAAERDNVAVYNCSYLPINHQQAFSEIMYILMCGTGVGFSVERQEINKLPKVPSRLNAPKDSLPIVFEDSKYGWARGYQKVINSLYQGIIPEYDLSKLRPAGAKLKIFGGRASGPAPLDQLIRFTINEFKKTALEAREEYEEGKRLTSIQVHSIICMIGEAVVSGGVRRSALISLSNLSDDRMRLAKSGNWFENNKHFSLSNNSTAYTEKPDMMRFFEEWTNIYKSFSGERGIFNRQAAKKKVRSLGRRDPNHIFGTNPCGEIILRPFGFCNLSEVVARSGDSLETLKSKVRKAVYFGVLQSTFTDFRYLRSIWKKNAEEERLLGVSITGIQDHDILGIFGDVETRRTWLKELKKTAIEECEKLCDRWGLNMSAAITCVKPSGTVSQLVNSSSGDHTRHSQLFVRTYRENNTSPVCQFLKSIGIPNEPDVTSPDTRTVFSFPVASPKGAVTRHDVTALQQLDHWLELKTYWCEHNPSASIYVRDHEWMEVGAWVYKHFDEVCGLTFFPFDNGTYQQAPYQEIDEKTYNELVTKMPSIDWSGLQFFEQDDQTEGSREYACVGGSCDLN